LVLLYLAGGIDFKHVKIAEPVATEAVVKGLIERGAAARLARAVLRSMLPDFDNLVGSHPNNRLPAGSGLTENVLGAAAVTVPTVAALPATKL
jgi:hypothetical protein